jgi:hypothetical protein
MSLLHGTKEYFMIFFRNNKNEVLVKRFNNVSKDSEIALLQFNGKIKETIIKELNNRFLLTGEYIDKGGYSSAKTITTLLSAGGSMGLSGAVSGQLFMATANPATLMTIGNGVGSAVMGAGGIVAQAPFIPIAGAIMPVAAPLIAFQAIATIMILNEFKTVNKKLDDIKSLIERSIERDEATNIGLIFSALNRLDEIEEEYFITKNFNQDMIIRLNLLENSINPLFERYNYLYDSAEDTVVEEIKYDGFGEKLLKVAANPWVTGIWSLLAKNELENRSKTRLVAEEDDAKYKRRDAYFAIITSILDIRISNLRVKMNMQENPEFIKYSIINFKNKVENYKKIWQKIREDYKKIENIANNIHETINSMDWWERNVPSWLGGKRTEYRNKKSGIEIVENDVNFSTKTITKMVDSNNESIKSLEQENYSNLLYWKDDFGEHSYYTNDIIIK